MMKIYKYPLSWEPSQIVQIPVVKILDIQCQNGNPCLWALVDENSKDIDDVEIVLIGTGNNMDWATTGYLTHISTTQIDGFVWHWFRRA